MHRSASELTTADGYGLGVLLSVVGNCAALTGVVAALFTHMLRKDGLGSCAKLSSQC